jgi:hypothetical protein
MDSLALPRVVLFYDSENNLSGLGVPRDGMFQVPQSLLEKILGSTKGTIALAENHDTRQSFHFHHFWVVYRHLMIWLLKDIFLLSLYLDYSSFVKCPCQIKIKK